MATPKLTNEQCKEAADALAACAGNQVTAAARLGLSRGTFQNRLRHAEDRGLVTYEDPQTVAVCGDNKLHTFATQRQLDVMTAVREHGSVIKAAEEMGVSGAEIKRTVQAAQRRASLRGYSPEYDWTHAVPETHAAKGVSTYHPAIKKTDAEGNVHVVRPAAWVKAEMRREAYLEAIREAVRGTVDGLPQIVVAAGPSVDYSHDVIPWIQVGDAHLGMLAHAIEVGENFDIKIAERELCGAIAVLIDEMPPCTRCVLNDLGDFTHYENFSATTEASGHSLDFDSRFPKMIRAYMRIMRFIVERLLTKCQHLDVIINQGNHSRTNDIWAAVALDALYGHTGRVHVLDNSSVFIGYRMGNTLVMVHHSDKCKPERLADVMAHDFRQDFGETQFHYVDVGHVHHRSVALDHNGVVVESWNHLAALDRWAHDAGYRSSRSISVVLRSRTYGEIGRRTLSIRELRDRLGLVQAQEKKAFVA
jgi:hypothetical protein